MALPAPVAPWRPALTDLSCCYSPLCPRHLGQSYMILNHNNKYIFMFFFNVLVARGDKQVESAKVHFLVSLATEEPR